MNGILLVDKPAGVTSHDLVEFVKKKLRAKKVGHTGTLDPFATGLMILCIGTATRLARFLGREDKIYRGQITLGYTTDTYDIEGKRQSRSPVPPLTKGVLQRAASSLTGKIKQIPPPFSAKRVAGTRSYHLARRGKPVSLEPVAVTVHYFKIDSYTKDNTVHFRAKVSTGTYIRSLAYDLGKIIGCGGTLTNLLRSSTGAFQLRQAIKSSDLVKITRDELRKKIIPLSQIPLKMQTARVEEAGQKLFSRGSSVPEAYLVENKGLSLEKEVKVTTKKGELLGIGIVSIIKTGKGHKITVKPKVVLT
jgi:tRNA pseudouridine55 synthase